MNLEFFLSIQNDNYDVKDWVIRQGQVREKGQIIRNFPIQLRINWIAFNIIIRSPGHWDFELEGCKEDWNTKDSPKFTGGC